MSPNPQIAKSPNCLIAKPNPNDYNELVWTLRVEAGTVLLNDAIGWKVPAPAGTGLFAGSHETGRAFGASERCVVLLRLLIPTKIVACDHKKKQKPWITSFQVRSWKVYLFRCFKSYISRLMRQVLLIYRLLYLLEVAVFRLQVLNHQVLYCLHGNLL